MSLASLINEFKLSENKQLVCIHIKAGKSSYFLLELLKQAREDAYFNESTNVSLSRYDQRDIYYDHILVIDKSIQEIVSGIRFLIYKKCNYKITQEHSYIEYSYPGFYQYNSNKNFVELGRAFAVEKYRKNHQIALLVLKTTLNIIAKETANIVGLITYDQNKNSSLANQALLLALRNKNLSSKRISAPAPKFECCDFANVPYFLQHELDNVITLKDACKLIENYTNQKLRVPVLLKQYYQIFNTKTLGISIGKDFNGLVEIMGYTDMSKIKHSRLMSLLTPVNLKYILGKTLDSDSY